MEIPPPLPAARRFPVLGPQMRCPLTFTYTLWAYLGGILASYAVTGPLVYRYIHPVIAVPVLIAGGIAVMYTAKQVTRSVDFAQCGCDKCAREVFAQASDTTTARRTVTRLLDTYTARYARRRRYFGHSEPDIPGLDSGQAASAATGIDTLRYVAVPTAAGYPYPAVGPAPAIVGCVLTIAPVVLTAAQAAIVEAAAQDCAELLALSGSQRLSLLATPAEALVEDTVDGRALRVIGPFEPAAAEAICELVTTMDIAQAVAIGRAIAS